MLTHLFGNGQITERNRISFVPSVTAGSRDLPIGEGWSVTTWPCATAASTVHGSGHNRPSAR